MRFSSSFHFSHFCEYIRMCNTNSNNRKIERKTTMLPHKRIKNTWIFCLRVCCSLAFLFHRFHHHHHHHRDSVTGQRGYSSMQCGDYGITVGCDWLSFVSPLLSLHVRTIFFLNGWDRNMMMMTTILTLNWIEICIYGFLYAFVCISGW